MAGYWAAGLWVPLVTRYYLLSLPGTLLGVALGRVLNRHLGGHRFLRWTYGGLAVVAIALLAQSLTA
jgi:uncharacterized protein